MQQSIALGVRRSPSVREATASRAILRSLAQHGVTVAFGIPGGLVSPIYDALPEVPGMRLVSTRHEAMAGFCAMGHFVATGSPALVLTTSGPGITNAVTALAAAEAEEIPLILVGGEVPTRSVARAAFQDATQGALDVVTMLRSVTRWSVRLEDASSAAAVATRAVRVATGPRPGPVFISVPLDVGNARARDCALSVAPPSVSAEPELEASARVAHALVGARRPLIVVGNGARSAAGEVRALAETVGCPVVVTAHAKGVFPESHELYLGVVGFGGHPSARDYLQSRPDVVLIVGSRVGDFATDGWSLSFAGTVDTFQIDRDGALLDRNCALTLGIVADAGAALRGILTALPPDLAPFSRERPRFRREDPSASHDDSVPLRPARVLRAFEEAFPDAFWTSDIGEHCAHVVHHVAIDRPERFRAMLGLASMGSGIGTAIGARHARPDRTVICVCGDGGFAMHAGDLLTCVQHGIGVVFVVFNDGRWNMVQHGFRAVYGREPSDLAQVARGFGAIGVRVEHPDALDPERLREVASTGRPVVFDVRIDPSDSLSVGSRSASVRRSAFGGGT